MANAATTEYVTVQPDGRKKEKENRGREKGKQGNEEGKRTGLLALDLWINFQKFASVAVFPWLW